MSFRKFLTLPIAGSVSLLISRPAKLRLEPASLQAARSFPTFSGSPASPLLPMLIWAAEMAHQVSLRMYLAAKMPSKPRQNGRPSAGKALSLQIPTSSLWPISIAIVGSLTSLRPRLRS
ncbi:hypothetical protein D9M69_634660 [compost metagenome]